MPWEEIPPSVSLKMRSKVPNSHFPVDRSPVSSKSLRSTASSRVSPRQIRPPGNHHSPLPGAFSRRSKSTRPLGSTGIRSTQGIGILRRISLYNLSDMYKFFYTVPVFGWERSIWDSIICVNDLASHEPLRASFWEILAVHSPLNGSFLFSSSNPTQTEI
jgi:hypothetical protein